MIALHVLQRMMVGNGTNYFRISSRYARRFHTSSTSHPDQNERLVEPTDGHDTTGQFDPAVHSTRGINTVSLRSSSWALDTVARQVIEASEEFPLNIDINSGNELGFGYPQSTIDHGVRSSSSTSYLAPRYINRPNLSVLLHAQVTRLLAVNGTKVVRTVEFTENAGGTFECRFHHFQSLTFSHHSIDP